MTLIISLLIYAIWIVYAHLEGFREGVHFHNRMTASPKDNIEMHPWFAAQRALMLIVCGGSTYLLSGNIWYALLFTASSILIFSLFHDGAYHKTRNKLNPKIYQDQWFANPISKKDSSAILDFNFNTRFVLGLIGFLVFGVSTVIYIIT